MSRHRENDSRPPIATLYIRNISERVRYEDIKKLFSKYGKISDITMPIDYYSRLPKGYCFIKYEEIRDAEEAQDRLDRQLLYGRELEVEFARGDRKSSTEMRSRESDRRDTRSSRYDEGPPRSHMNGRSNRRRSRSRSGSRGGKRRRSPRSNDRDSRSRSRSRTPVERHKKKSSASPKAPKSPVKRRGRSESRSRSITHSRSQTHSPDRRSIESVEHVCGKSVSRSPV